VATWPKRTLTTFPTSDAVLASAILGIGATISDLRAYLERRAKDGIVGLVRWSAEDGMVIFPPTLSSNGEWHEVGSGVLVNQHSPEDVFRALAAGS
jgi:hypothetical protein